MKNINSFTLRANKQAFVAYKLRLNIIAEVYWLNTPGWKQIFNQMNCPLKWPMGPCNFVLWESPRVCSQIIQIQFLEKIYFLCFWEPPKFFFEPFNWSQKLHFWGVLTSKTFWSEQQFKSLDFEIAIFGQISPGYLQNCGLDQKVLEVWPPQE